MSAFINLTCIFFDNIYLIISIFYYWTDIFDSKYALLFFTEL